MAKLRQLKRGDYFTKKHYDFPTESQVWVRDDYDRTSKKYYIYNYADVNKSTLMSGDKEVFTDFTF